MSEPQNYIGDVISIDTTSGKWKVDFESNQRGVACKKAVGGAGVSSCGNGCFQEDICEVKLLTKKNLESFRNMSRSFLLHNLQHNAKLLRRIESTLGSE